MSRRIVRTILVALAPLIAACSSSAPPPPPELTQKDLQLASLLDVLWEWTATEEPTETRTVEDPSLYTIRFEAGVRAALRADCNRGFAKYTVTGNGIHVDPRVMTKAACPPESRDFVFLRELEEAVTWEIVGGELHFALRGDGATMKFRAAPPKS